MRLLLLFFLCLPSIFCSVIDERKDWKRLEEIQYKYYSELEKADLIAEELFSLYPSLKPATEEGIIELKRTLSSFLDLDIGLEQDKPAAVYKQRSTHPSYFIRMVEDGGMTPDPEKYEEVKGWYSGCRKKAEELMAAGDYEKAAEQISYAVMIDDDTEKALEEYKKRLSSELYELVLETMKRIMQSKADDVNSKANDYHEMRKNLPIHTVIKRMSDDDFSSHSWNLRLILAHHDINIPRSAGLPITNLFVEQEIQVLELSLVNSSSSGKVLGVAASDPSRGRILYSILSQDLSFDYFSLLLEKSGLIDEMLHEYIISSATDRSQGKKEKLEEDEKEYVSVAEEWELVRMIKKLYKILEEEFDLLEEEEQNHLESVDNYVSHKLKVQLPKKATMKKYKLYKTQKFTKKQRREHVLEKERSLFLLWHPEVDEEDLPDESDLPKEFRRTDEL